MKFIRVQVCLLVMILVATILAEALTDSGTVAGTIRDSEGKPLAGLTIILIARQTPLTTYRVLSGLSGNYRFTDLAIGDYTLSVDSNTYIGTSPSLVRVQATTISVITDLTLSDARSLYSETDRSQSASSTSSPVPLEFEASGIRGLIDPGGYSASTGSIAAAGLLRGIAEVKRINTTFAASAAKDWPCRLEPELLRTVSEHSDQFEANSRLGQFYVSHNMPARAIPFLRRASEIDHSDYTVSRALAIAWLERGEFDSARKQLISLEERQNILEIHQLLARADEGLGLFEQATQEYRKAQSEEPSEESAFGIGYELILVGSVADGVAAFEAGLQMYPRSIPLRIGAGTAQFLHGQTAKALHNFLQAADIDPRDSRPYSFLSAASGISTDESDRVRYSLKRFLELQPDSATANYFYALALSRKSPPVEEQRVEILLKRAIQLDPNLARAHLQLADLNAQREDYGRAVSEYEAAVRLDPDLIEAHYRLARAYMRVGRSDQSAHEMQVFRMSKGRQTSGSDGIDLAQFVSVMDSPHQQAVQSIQCRDTLR